MEAMNMSVGFLKKITDNFSDKRILGKGTLGVVYKGDDGEGHEIAVKLFNSMHKVDDEQFHRDCKNLATLKHQNIVKLVGFCSGTEEVHVEYNGKQIITVNTYKALCFEYLCNGSLQKYISDVYKGFNWQERYQIILGICEGLKYLHKRPGSTPYHLNLNLDNILLGKNMAPKIADFGLSTLFREGSVSFEGTREYVPPEYIQDQVISKEFDIFSLGIIILKIMVGHTGYLAITGMGPAEVIGHVHNLWRRRLLTMPGSTSLEAKCQQVKGCVEIAVKCLEEDRYRRPTIADIIRYLHGAASSRGLQGEIFQCYMVKKILAGCLASHQQFRQMPLASTIVMYQKDCYTSRSDDTVYMTLEFLKTITGGFSNERVLGKGSFGVVYMGVDADGQEIAVKLLKDSTRDADAVDGNEFNTEFNCLTKLKHPNIVRLVGFCNEASKVVTMQHNGRYIMAEKIERALCFEYMHNGSLEKYLYDVHDGFDWQERYKIIKGICEGLKYLHTGAQIYHLDLKPENILLDTNMVPKISDFGLSKLIGEKNTIKTLTPKGTLGYIPPEFFHSQEISKEYDIFSLGVIIIKIMIGHKGYSFIGDKKPAEIVEHVHETWSKRLQGNRTLEKDRQQVKKCIEIALKCKDDKKINRPTIVSVVDQLNETETQAGTVNIFPGTLPKELPAAFLREITNDFSDGRQLFQTEFGTVYKGVLYDGSILAVTKLTENAPVDDKFDNEVRNLIAIEHENIVRLIAYCQEDTRKVMEYNGRYVLKDMTERFLCYEYLPKGSLDKYIYGVMVPLPWSTRMKIALGAAKGLAFLHEAEKPVIHRNFKTSNILLDEEYNAKLSDFGLAKDGPVGDESHVSTRVLGTYGYAAPEYIMTGHLTAMSDVYNYGVVLLELLTGRKSLDRSRPVREQMLVDWACPLLTQKKKVLGIVDPRLAEDYPVKAVQKTAMLAYHCLSRNPNARPLMRDIVATLELLQQLEETPSDSVPMTLEST